VLYGLRKAESLNGLHCASSSLSREEVDQCEIEKRGRSEMEAGWKKRKRSTG
jgi:hypothetical protein